MSLIQTVSPESAQGEVAAIYSQMRERMGMIPNAFQLRSASPQLLRQQMDNLGYYLAHPTLSPALLACIRLLVSQKTDCAYCVDFNSSLLVNMLGWNLEQVVAARADVQAANLPERERALLAFVLETVAAPKSVTAEGLDALRALGWTDRDILDGLNHGAYMVAGDILLNAFKVEKDL